MALIRILWSRQGKHASFINGMVVLNAATGRPLSFALLLSCNCCRQVRLVLKLIKGALEKLSG